MKYSLVQMHSAEGRQFSPKFQGNEWVTYNKDHPVYVKKESVFFGIWITDSSLHHLMGIITNES